MLKRTFQKIRDLAIAGLVFLLPLVVLIILLSKVFQFLTGFTGKIAKLFGLNEIAGISGGTIVSAISIILLCMLCGYLVRISFFKSMRDWLDEKLSANIPGYSTYREMALSKLEPKEEELPYISVVWLQSGALQQPGFLVDEFPDRSVLVFVPRAGNVKEGKLYRVAETSIERCNGKDMKAFQEAIDNRGIGLSKV